jgi:hypothetical protein
MKDSIEILNYIKEAKGLEEKYKSLHAELDIKYQLDQYLLDQKYQKSTLSWDIQKNIINKYLIEKDEEKIKIINKMEKEREQIKDKKSLEKIVKDLEVAKDELKEIRALKKIFDLKNEDLKKEKERKNDFRSDGFANNGGNIRYNK